MKLKTYNILMNIFVITLALLISVGSVFVLVSFSFSPSIASLCIIPWFVLLLTSGIGILILGMCIEVSPNSYSNKDIKKIESSMKDLVRKHSDGKL